MEAKGHYFRLQTKQSKKSEEDTVDDEKTVVYESFWDTLTLYSDDGNPVISELSKR